MFDSVIAILVFILKIVLMATAIWAYATVHLKGLMFLAIYIAWTDVIGLIIIEKWKSDVYRKMDAGQMSIPWGESADVFYTRISSFQSIIGTIILGLGLFILVMEIKKLKR